MTHHRRVIRSAAAVALCCAVIFGTSFVLVGAQSFVGPQAAPPNNADINNLVDIYGLNHLTLPDVRLQSLAGPLVVASSTPSQPTNASAFLGKPQYGVPVLGIAGAALPPAPGTINNPGSAVLGYAYAASPNASFGAYGYALGGGGVGVLARSSSTIGFAGRFFGAVRVDDGDAVPAPPGTVTVADIVSAPQVFASSTPATLPVASTNGIKISGAFANALYGDALSNYGVYGQSDGAAGFYALNTTVGAVTGCSAADGCMSLSTPAILGIYAVNEDTVGNAGAYGRSSSGNGAAGIGANASLPLVEGKAMSSTGLDAGLYGRGGAYAGYFEGDVKIDDGETLTIGQQVVTKASLQKLIEWCRSTSHCLDNYVP